MTPQDVDGSESNVVPESLLAFAKDTRYLEECKTLVLQVLQKLLPNHQDLDSDAWYLSAVLYTALVLVKKGRTLGMEICGLRYPESIARWKVVGASLATASTVYAMHRATAANRSGDPSCAPNTESLRGTQRREVFERQRQAMLRRANVAPDASSNRNAPSLDQQQSSNPTDLRERLRGLLRQGLRSIATAASSLSSIEGPHGPTETHQTTLTAGIWFLRLHLAYYCLTGRYPSWTHRLVGHTMEEDGTKRLVSRPNNFRVVGLLILAQAAGTAIQVVSRQVTHWWIDRSVRSTPTQTCSIVFEGDSSPPQSSPVLQTSNVATCGICQQVRKYPACAATCGHVFCWKCLQQWSLSRGECPLCRTACRPQDILALHQYAPVTE